MDSGCRSTRSKMRSPRISISTCKELMCDDNASPVIQQRDEIVRGSAPLPVAAALWAARCAFAIRASHSEAATVTPGRSQQSHRNRANLRLASRVLRAPGFRERNSILPVTFFTAQDMIEKKARCQIGSLFFVQSIAKSANAAFTEFVARNLLRRCAQNVTKNTGLSGKMRVSRGGSRG
jgi:hypothetical protein